MKVETKFNIGDKVCFKNDKRFVYEIYDVGVRDYRRSSGVIIEYKICRPFIVNWANEDGICLAPEAPEIVTNKDCVHTLVHTLRDIYGVDELPIPEGYKFKDFAHPKVGEYIVSNVRLTTDPKFVVGICQINITSPRVILERK